QFLVSGYQPGQPGGRMLPQYALDPATSRPHQRSPTLRCSGIPAGWFASGGPGVRSRAGRPPCWGRANPNRAAAIARLRAEPPAVGSAGAADGRLLHSGWSSLPQPGNGIGTKVSTNTTTHASP